MGVNTEWNTVTSESEIQHIVFGAGNFAVRHTDAVYIGDGNDWRQATATEVFDYFVKIDHMAKDRFANMTLWKRIRLAFKGDLS